MSHNPKVRVRHLGPGSTNPTLLHLAIYLAWGFERWPESEWEKEQQRLVEERFYLPFDR